ncbi:MAG: type VI secretion protein IcmF, partial [Legionella sp.]
MDNSLHALCDAIKKILSQLKPQSNHLSFIVLTGKNDQGKSALLKQSNMEEMSVFSEQHAKIYYNQQGIIVELGENWLSNSKTLLQNTLKQLNKCSRYLKITGLILCVDVNTLLSTTPSQFAEHKKANIHILERLGVNLGYHVELALIFTKMDALAGFSEYYQMDHVAELAKPLGFSLDCINQLGTKVETFGKQFNWLIESLGQQVINKMHPARSTMKRSLIREFPLQLASLRAPIQSLIQNISPKLFNLHSIYFTSAEQGGVSIDRLNKKIQHEYALVVQDTFPQATNFRAYFIEGALKSIQLQCVQAPQPLVLPQKTLISIAAGMVGISLVYLCYHHYQASNLLDQASKELIAYDMLKNQGITGAQALYHLSSAAQNIDHIASNSLSLPSVSQLKVQLNGKAEQRLNEEFLPSLINELEQTMLNSSNTPLARYNALKIYLMLGQTDHFSATMVDSWFNNQWKEPTANNANKLALLKQRLSKPWKAITIKQQVINDARNNLNALPTSYLYYSIAKEYFPLNLQKIQVEGFNLLTTEVPTYYTRAGFEEIIKKLPEISTTLQNDNWVLARQDLSQLPNILTQAYAYDYVNWWQTFLRKSHPQNYHDYQSGRQVVKLLQQSNAMSNLINIVQQQTKPDLNANLSPFNQYIANQFT